MIFIVGTASVENFHRDASLDMPMPESDAQMNRCYWRSRRGLLELDLLLPPFVRARFATLSERQRAALERLLACEDVDIWAWFRGESAPASTDLVELVASIAAFNAE